MDKETEIEYITTVEYAVRVFASSSTLSEQELRQIVKKSVEEDLAPALPLTDSAGARVIPIAMKRFPL